MATNKIRMFSYTVIIYGKKKLVAKQSLLSYQFYYTSYNYVTLVNLTESNVYFMWQVKQSALPTFGLTALGKSPDNAEGIPLDTRKNVGLSMLCGS
jgi:hypothetical protein